MLPSGKSSRAGGKDGAEERSEGESRGADTGLQINLKPPRSGRSQAPGTTLTRGKGRTSRGV